MGKLRDKISSMADGRSSEALRQIALSGVAKCITILTSLLIVPLTIDYVNKTQYGIWLTLSSIIAWISYCDFGLSNGFRNRFAEAKAKGDIKLARQYVSTTYFAIGAVVTTVLVIALIANHFIDWPSVLKVDALYQDELQKVFAILSTFFCLNMVATIFTILLTADQRPGLSAIVNALGQVASLVAIWILTHCSEGSLFKLALYFSGIPCIVILLISIVAYNFSRYKEYRPGIKQINTSLVRNILSLGLKFFMIYLCLLVIFQMMNIIISRELGPDAVTEYNIAFKYFNVLFGVMLIIITPFWSSFTDAYTKKDYAWMKNICGKLEIMWLVSIVLGLVMLAIAPFVYKVWVKDACDIATTTSVAVLIYILAQIIGNIYMYMINGIGTIRIQLVIYVISAIIAWPLMVFSCRHFGVCGIVSAPALACAVQAIFGKIQLSKIINQKASGWWLK